MKRKKKQERVRKERSGGRKKASCLNSEAEEMKEEKVFLSSFPFFSYPDGSTSTIEGSIISDEGLPARPARACGEESKSGFEREREIWRSRG